MPAHMWFLIGITGRLMPTTVLDLPMDWVIELNTACSSLLRPEVTFYLDLPLEESMKRISARKGQTELFEKKEIIRKVRANYLESMERLQGEENLVKINADQSPEDMFTEIWKVVANSIGVS